MGKKKSRTLRNSNIELLRIISMLCIVIHHFYVHNGSDIGILPDSLVRSFFSTYGVTLGKVGVAIFFIISIWYTNEATLTLKKSIRRCLLLEKEVLFYSIILGCICLVADADYNFNLTNLARMFFPLMTCVWWFLSDYAVLIILLPFVMRGLKVLTARQHLQFTCIVVFCYGLWQYIPIFGAGVRGGGDVTMMIVIICCTYFIKWHVDIETLTRHWPVILVTLLTGVGLVAICRYLSFFQIPIFSSVSRNLFNSISSGQCVLVLLIAFSVFILFSVLPVWHNSVINSIAGSTLSVYLISDFLPVRTWLWTVLFPYSNLGNHALLLGIPICIIVLSVCVGIDYVRRWVFSLFDRHPGKYIDAVLSRFS